MALNYDSSDPTQIPVPGPIRGNYDPALLPMVDPEDVGPFAFVKSLSVQGTAVTSTVVHADGTTEVISFTTGGVAAAVDVPHFVSVASSYVASTDTIEVAGYGGTTLPSTYFIFLFMPAVIGRSADPLTFEIGSDSYPLFHATGVAAKAADIPPRALLTVLKFGTAFYFTETPPLRPIDFLVHMYLFDADVSEGPPDYLDSSHALTQSLVDGATYHTMSTEANRQRVDFPTGFTIGKTFDTGADVYDQVATVAHYLAVPDDAYDILMVNSPPYQSFGIGPFEVYGTFNIGGVPHKFYQVLYPYYPDFSVDPPTDWFPLYVTGGTYWLIEFEGFPAAKA